MLPCLIRRERSADVPIVRSVVAAAFANPDAPSRMPVEVGLLDELRADAGWMPALSLVAVVADAGHEVIGHVAGSRGTVDGRAAIGLGPLAVRPDRQRCGVGSALVHAVLAAAEALGEPLVALLGDPGYYRRFGFRPAADYRIVAPEPQWGDHFQARALAGGPADAGTFAYAAPFGRL